MNSAFLMKWQALNFRSSRKTKKLETIGVDLGINTDAVCSIIQKDGTVTEQRFINHPVEKDRMYGLLNTIKKHSRTVITKRQGFEAGK